MKKILSLIIILLTGMHYLEAQTSGAAVTIIPSGFTAEDQVKIIVDVSGVPNLKNKEPLYIWTWEPSDASPGNGAWDNSSESRKMVKEGPNKWSWTFTPTQYYSKSPAEITQISFLVKAKDGSGDTKTDDIKLAVAPLIFVPSVFRMFPKAIGKDEVATFYLDQSLAKDVVTERMIPSTARISLWDDANNQIDVEKTITLTKLGDKLFSYSFLPSRTFSIPNGKTVNKLVVVFKGKGKDVNGNEINVESPPFEYGFNPLQ